LKLDAPPLIVTQPDRFFSATILGGRLHVQGVPDWGRWNCNRIDRFPENQIVIVPEVGDRMIRTCEELEAAIKEPMNVAPTRNIWIHESLEDEARWVWETGPTKGGLPK
jgi:hypothetical protein